MRKKIEWLWEELDQNTMRAKVIGGWILMHNKHALAEKGNKSHLLCSESMVFIADRDHEWHISTLRPEEKPEAKVQAADFEAPKS